MDEQTWATLPEYVLFRIQRQDSRGKTFGTPRNPRVPTLIEFNPRLVGIRADELARMIVQRKHGLFPDQAERIGQMTNAELVQFRVEDPISASQIESGLSLTGGHHRTHEINQRVANGQLEADTMVGVLLHD